MEGVGRFAKGEARKDARAEVGPGMGGGDIQLALQHGKNYIYFPRKFFKGVQKPLCSQGTGGNFYILSIRPKKGVYAYDKMKYMT